MPELREGGMEYYTAEVNNGEDRILIDLPAVEIDLKKILINSQVVQKLMGRLLSKIYQINQSRGTGVAHGSNRLDMALASTAFEFLKTQAEFFRNKERVDQVQQVISSHCHRGA